MHAEIDVMPMIQRLTDNYTRKCEMIKRREKAGTLSEEGARVWAEREKKKYHELMKRLMRGAK